MNETPTTGRPRRAITRRGLLSGAVGGAVVLSSGAAWAVDRYLVEHVEVTGASSRYAVGTASASASSAATGSVSASTYQGPSGTVTVRTVETGTGQDKVTYCVADAQLASPTALMSAFAKDTFGNNVIEVPSAMAQRVGAVCAVNGDYYGFRSTGIEVRNGAVFRDQGARQGLAIYRDGTFALYDETATTAATLVSDGVWHTLSFGPGIVDGGAVLAGIESVEIDRNVGNHSIQGNHPRTAIGMVSPGHVVMVVVDGRSPGYSRGVTLPELATIMAGLGCQVAYNLDGGGSSAMWFDNDIVSRPRGTDKERGTSDILYIGR
ncbi:MAG: phosphodiester glycosidase family protein [Actinomycetia bacterium]|nr:phosphodiester glycosidase family protein [Actinomycetes bacterium]